MLSSKIAKFLISIVAVSFTLACLQRAGLPVERALDLVGGTQGLP